MSHQLTGRILYASGSPAANVRVRVFDQDAPGKIDDDLTVEEGLSDAEGQFTVRFAPSKYLDWREVTTREPRNLPFDWTLETRTRRLPDLTDLYLPYLRFDYAIANRPRTHRTFLQPFQRKFRLPELPPSAFLPSQHGFKFVNRFKGYFIPFSVPAIPDIPSVTNIYGLCGGMVASAYDFLLAGREIPAGDKAPKRASPLHQYIYRRQNDSFGPLGDQIVRFARWMALPDDTMHGTQRKTHDEFEQLRASLDDGNPSPIGLVYVSTEDTLEIWKNHQVLAYGYTEREDGTLDVHIYDPNYPLRDDVTVQCARVPLGSQFVPGLPPRVTTQHGFKCVQRLGGQKHKDVRGFFAMPYVAVEPPAGSEADA